MVGSDIFSQAQRGDPKAIAALMNHSLQRKQVTVRAALRAGCLTILATSRECPDAQFMANFVRRGLDRLQPGEINRVVIRGYAIGTIGSLWTAEFDPRSDAPPQIANIPQTGFPSTAQSRTSSHQTSKTVQASRSTRPRSHPTSNQTSNPRTPRSTRPKPRPKPRSKSRPNPGLKTSAKRSTKSTKTKVSALTVILDHLLGALAILTFITLSIVTVGLSFGCKVWTARLAETVIYQIQFLGDLLRGLEAAEVFNIVVFAILGLGLGLATALVPRSSGIRITATVGLLVLPVIFSVSSLIRYQSWIDEFAAAENLSEAQAIAQTDIYLQTKVEHTSFAGFYLHTAKYPGLPTTRVQMEQIDALESQAADRLEVALSRVLSSLPFQLELPQIFALCMWGIRVFYVLLSLMTAISNFIQGVRWADALTQRRLTG